MEKKKQTFLNNLKQIYTLLCKNNLMGFLLFYFKISIVHIAFEAVLTFLYIAPLVIYPNMLDTHTMVPLSAFFGKIMLSCARIFTSIIALYVFSLFLWCVLIIIRYDAKNFSFWQKICQITFGGICFGIIVYLFIGFWVSRDPDFFAGTKIASLTTYQKNFIFIKIFLLGILWAVQSFLRYLRINKYVIILEPRNPISHLSQKTNKKIVNETTLFFRVLSVVFQIVSMCIVLLLLISSYKHIPCSKDSFDYYNLILIIYFGVFSTFSTICYKLEISRDYPSCGVCYDESYVDINEK